MTNLPTTIRLGTRASKLAMWQSNWVKAELEKLGAKVELVQIKTEGDENKATLAQIGGQGVFTKRLQVALLANEVDLAVHSLKDLPTEDHDELKIAAIPPREKTTDALVSNDFDSIDSLPSKAKVGTGSTRRAAQLLHLRSDLQILDIRGNVDTRLAKLDAGNYDAIVLACAGLKRLGLENRIAMEIPLEKMLPAVGQGALGLEIRSNDPSIESFVSQLSDHESFSRAMAERSMLKSLFAGCLAPVGANSFFDQGKLILEGAVLSTDGTQKFFSSQSSDANQFAELGKQVAADLLAQGAAPILERTP